MDHFYVQCEEKDVKIALNALKESGKHIDKQNIYIDSLENEKNWNKLINSIKEDDRLVVPDIFELSIDTQEFKKKLEVLIEKQIEVYDLDGQKFYVDQMLKAVEFTLSRGMYKQKIKQREGIEKALIQKRNGTGEYGRPRVFLPDDFEEKIKMIMAKQMSHETYRAKLGMKRSTYFKVVKELKDSWKKIS